jgi:SAM-dependent methyltransferase
MDAGSPWTRADTVAGFVQSPPNATLMAFADAELRRLGRRARVVDVGCGAGRNAVPLAAAGWDVFGIDLSMPMLVAATARRAEELPDGRIDLACAAMDAVPARDRIADLVVVHGIWNLARSGAEFRRAVREAARLSRPGAALFVFTFSRSTLPPHATPVAGEAFVFTDFSGEPQCFLTEPQLMDALEAHDFVRDRVVPFTEHNLPRPGALPAARTPVIYEGAFRFEPMRTTT